MDVHHGVRTGLMFSPFLSHSIRCLPSQFQAKSKLVLKKYSTKEDKREKLFKEIKKGYFHHVTDYQKSGGKQSLASQHLIPSASAVLFPNVEVKSLSGLNSSLKNKITGKVTLLVSCLRATGMTMFPLYRQPFLEVFEGNSKISYKQLNIVNQPIVRYFSSSIIRSLKKQTPIEQHEYFLCHFGAAKEIQNDLFGNILVAHAFLLDTAGKIRWTCHAKPTSEEIELLIKFTKELNNRP